MAETIGGRTLAQSPSTAIDGIPKREGGALPMELE